MILLIVIGLVVTFALVFILFGCFQCFVGKHSKGFKTFVNPEDGEFREVTVSHGNEGFSMEPSDLITVDSSDFTPVAIEPLPDILAKTVSTSALRPRIRCIEKSKQESALRLISVHHPFPRAQLTYVEEIGSTWFGKVIVSDADSIITGVSRSRVIAKVLKEGASSVEQNQFLEDVAPYRELDHSNVIRLLGQCTETAPLILVLEYAPLGDLKSYLNSHKQDTSGLFKKNMQLKFSIDVASGLACLHRHNYIHHDLAARTCLVAGDQTVKIGDYGLCEEKYPSDYYNNGQELLPLRWMSPESLELQDLTWQISEITKESNIWSFGVLLWEILTFGSIPYTALPNEQVLDGVIKQKLIKLRAPDSNFQYKDKMFEVMQFCWLEPSQRPTIEDVHSLLQNLYKQTTEVQSENDLKEFDSKWDSLIPQSVQVNRLDNVVDATPHPKQFDSNFLPPGDAQDSVPQNPVGLSTTVNGGFDFNPPMSVPDNLDKQDTHATPFKPMREHLTSTPMSKDGIKETVSAAEFPFEKRNAQTDFETMLKDEGLSPMNDSALEEDTFLSSNKPDTKPNTIEETRQADGLVSSADTVTSGVVTGDFSLSGKHSEQVTPSSSPSTNPGSKTDEIQASTNESSQHKEIQAIIGNTDNIIQEDNFKTERNAGDMKDEVTLATEPPLMDSMSENFEFISSMEGQNETSVFTDSVDNFINISNHNNLKEAQENPVGTAAITSTLAADIDEFMNASFDSPMNVSDDKSVDNLTDLSSDLDMILYGKTSSDLSSSNEALEESNQNVERKPDKSNATSIIEPESEQVGNFVNNELKVLPNLNEKQRQALCEIKTSTPVNNFNSYSRATEYFNDEQKDISFVNGACSPVVNESVTNNCQSDDVSDANDDDDGDDDDDDDDSSSNSSGSSYVCDYDINNVETVDSKETDSTTVVKTEDCNESESGDESDNEVFSMNEEEIQFASELYLSKGVNSPSVFEKTPLETIPEDDLPSPRDFESFDFKFEGQLDDVFTSQDNFEWDDFMGESLVGRTRSSDMSPKRALDFSDWMVEDDVSLRSNSSALSNSKNINGVRSSTRSDFNSASSLNSPSVRSSISESEVKRSQLPHKPKSYISELISNHSTGSLTSSYRNHQTSSFYSLYDNMDLDDSTSDEQSYTDLIHSNYSYNNIDLGKSYIGNMHDMISSKGNHSAASGTNKVFGTATMTTDLDEDLPDYDMVTDINQSDSKERTLAPAENLLDL